MIHHKKLAIFLIASLLWQVAASAQEKAEDRYAHLGFNNGRHFPDIVLPEISSNKAMSIADFRGKKIVVLHFASW